MKVAIVSVISRLECGYMRSATIRSILKTHHDVEVGAHSYGSLLIPGMADRKTRIGRYVSIGPNVRRFGAAHPIEATSLHPYWYNPALGRAQFADDVERTGVVIEDDCWIGANTTILPGCRRIGIGAVIGAGSVVTHDVADFTVVVGVPARVKSARLTECHREALLSRRPWDHSPDECRRILDEISTEYA